MVDTFVVTITLTRTLTEEEAEELRSLLGLEEQGRFDDEQDQIYGVGWPVEGNDRISISLFREYYESPWDIDISVHVPDGQAVARDLARRIVERLQGSKFEIAEIYRNWEQRRSRSVDTAD